MNRFIHILRRAKKNQLFKIALIRPRYFFLLFKIRVIESLGIDVFFLSPRFLMIYLFEEFNLKKKKNFDLKKFGNYFLDLKKVNNDKKFIVYSGGVGKNISFDKEITKHFDCKARLFDPTPESIKYMKNINLKNIFFYPYALYKENKKVKIFFDRFNQVKSNSITNFLNFDKNDFYFCNAYNIPYFMKKFNDTSIEVLKLDIEGVTMEVVLNCFQNKIFPNQMLLAIEVPMNYQKFFKFYKNLKKFVLDLKKHYEVINLRDRSRGVELEILCIKK